MWHFAAFTFCEGTLADWPAPRGGADSDYLLQQIQRRNLALVSGSVSS